MNNLNNKRLAAASAALVAAHAHADAEEAEHAAAAAVHDHDPSHAVSDEILAAEAAVEKARKKKDKIRNAEGGGATGVGTRMGY